MSAREKFTPVGSQHIVFQGEVQLLNWSDTLNGGAKIVLQLADAADLEAFKLMTVKKGKIAGQRLATVMVEIGPDEAPVDQVTAQPDHEPVKTRPGELCVMACNFCADPIFRQWVGAFHGPCDTEANAKAFILKICEVTSRKELDTNSASAQYFLKLVRAPYLQWRAQP